MQTSIWVIWGGVFTDSSFRTLEPGTEELHGPFHDRATAAKVWRERMQRQVDIATHRLFIMEAKAGGSVGPDRWVRAGCKNLASTQS